MKRALTLMETLAVLVVLAMVGAMSATSLLRISDHARMQAGLRHVLDLDMTARSSAPSYGPMSISRVESRIELRRLETNELIAARDISVALLLQSAPGRLPITTVHFDSRGRSDDYDINLTFNAACLRRSVCGLTGWVFSPENST